MEYKDIDRLFQEKLKDKEVTPNPKVWNAIEKKLQKKKRRVLPIWWFSGAASLFLLGSFLVFNFYKNKQHKNNNLPVITKEVIEENKTDKKNIEENKIELLKEELKGIDTKVTEKENKDTSLEAIKNTISSSEDIVKKESFKDSLILVDSKIAEKEKDNTLEEVIKNNTFSFEDIVEKQEKERFKNTISSSKDVVEKDSFKRSSTLKNDKVVEKEKGIALEESTNKDEYLKLEEKEEEWTISPVVGVLKSNSFSQASALDANLNNNDFSGESTFSYGVNITYKLNKKWAIKSGIQLQESAFTTNNVTLNSSAVSVANTLENVDFNSVDSNNSLSSDEAVSFDINDPKRIATEQGNIQQNYSYIEVPVEIKYTFFSSQKIQTSIISGFSSLILSENSIVGESSSFNQNIGGANNLNLINFSGNFGFDVDFLLTKKLNLNINPVFKTQLNTFSKNSNGFQPYLLGIYTGVIYKF